MSTTNDLYLVYNGRLWNTNGEDFTWMVFDQQSGYIQEVGRGEAPVSKFPEEVRSDYGGRRVFPGFHEAHIHIKDTGLSLTSVNLNACQSIEDIQDCVRKYVAENPNCYWVVGTGWEQNRIGRMPSKEDIDSVCSDRPVFLLRVCIHIGVANTKALEIAGFTNDSVSPEGATIDRYPAGHPLEGNLTGILREHGVVDVVLEKVNYTSYQKKIAIKAALDLCLSYGITSAHSNDLETWEEFKELAKADQLPVRIFHAAYFRGRHSGNFPTPGETHGGMLSCDRIKLFADGALGSSTAALSRPYVCSENKGLLLHTQDELNSMVQEATGLGFRLEIHAIGDAAAESVLTALETAGVAPEKRPLLTHCQILRHDLIGQMKKLGVIANIQPQMVNSDGLWLTKQLPTELLDYAYAWRTLLKEGIRCSGGSDAPVEEPCPLLGIYDAIFRRVGSRTADNTNIFRPEEAVTVKEAVDMYTVGGAYATLQEHRLGQLSAGFQADFVVIQQVDDPISDPEMFATAKVGEVWVAGKRRL